MKPASKELSELFDSGRPHFEADIWTITLHNGTVLRYTSADVDLVWEGQVYSAHGPLIQRGEIQQTLGLDTDTLDITLSAGDQHLLAGRPWMQAVRLKLLNGATFLLERLYADDWTTPIGVMPMFSGTFGELEDLTPYEIKFKVNGVTALLDILMPRDMYTPTCTHTIYAERCTLQRETHAIPSVVADTASYLRIPVKSSAADGEWALGELEVTSGVMAGLTASIRTNQDGALVLSTPLPEIIATGTSIRIYPGCDGTRARCKSFGNISNFRGFPLIPTAETIV